MASVSKNHIENIRVQAKKQGCDPSKLSKVVLTETILKHCPNPNDGFSSEQKQAVLNELKALYTVTALATAETSQTSVEHSEKQEKPMNQSEAITTPAQLHSNALSLDVIAQQVNANFSQHNQELRDSIQSYALKQTFTTLDQLASFLNQLQGLQLTLLVELLQKHSSENEKFKTAIKETVSAWEKKDDVNNANFIQQSQKEMLNLEVMFREKYRLV